MTNFFVLLSRTATDASKTNGKTETNSQDCPTAGEDKTKPTEKEPDVGEPVDLDFLDYEAMEGHSDNEVEGSKADTGAVKTTDHAPPAAGKNQDDGASSDDSSSKGNSDCESHSKNFL